MGDRAALVSLFVDNGVFDPKEMRRIYDEGGDTADIKPAVIEASYPREKEVLELVNNSKADFVSRLKDDNRVTIPDWKDANKVATHKLAYAQDGNRWIIYPLVQNIDGNLYDFEDPKYGMDKGWQALDSALYSGDYVELPSKADARWFTESYKNHYPGFNKYEDGGDKKYGVDAISGADTNPVDTDPQKSKTAWFDWWYKYRGKQIDDERKASGKYLTSKNKYNTDFLNYVNSRINNVGESYNDINGEIDSPEFITAASKDSVARKQILDYGHDYNSDDYVKSANIVDLITRGFYTPGLNHIIYNPRNGRLRDDTIIHERTHTLRDNSFYYNYISAARKFVKDGNHILMDNNDFDNYLDSHKEVYARLNEFRYTNNLNPSHNITKDEINVFRKNGLLKKYDLDRYTDDWLYFLFNGLADSGEPIQNWSGVNSAALGGLFNMYDGKTERSQKISRGYYQDKDGDIYDGARSGSQRMVRLGNDDYFVPEEFGPAVVTAGKGDKPKIEIPINYLFPGGSDVDEVFGVLEPSVISAERKPMTKRQIRKGSRIVRNVLDNLGENGSYTPLQKKRMAEYIIRAQGGLPNPSIPRVIEMRKGLKYKNKDGVSGLERVLYGDERIKDIIDSINSDHISYDDDGAKVVRGFRMYNYNGTIMNEGEMYDNDIVDAYINGVAPYGGKAYTSQYNFGPYKNYLDRYYKGKDVKSYMFGESELPQDTIDRLDRYAYERGDNSFVVGANTDKNVGFHLAGNKEVPEGVDFDAAGHLWQFIKDDDGKFYVRQSDSYDFEPNQYRESYGDTPYITEALSALESAGTPVLVFNPWREADDLDLSELTKGKILVDEVDEDAVKKAVEYNKQKKNGKFLNVIDDALTSMYSVTR